MADALYLSLWYPNLRLASLAEKLTTVLGEFAKHGGEPLVYATTVWPVSWHEAPVFQRVYGRAVQSPGGGPAQLGAEPKAAVNDALELLHDDYAYEFQIGWNLWELEDASWVKAQRLVRVTGFGPLFDEGAYEQEGHIRIDFGNDAPFLPQPNDEDPSPGAPDLEEDAELDSNAVRLIAENVRRLVDLTNAVEKASGATARLLWSELGESLAQRLAARLGKGN